MPWETNSAHRCHYLCQPTSQQVELHLSNFINNWKPTQFQLHSWRMFPSILNTISPTHLIVIVAREDHIATCHLSYMVNSMV